MGMVQGVCVSFLAVGARRPLFPLLLLTCSLAPCTMPCHAQKYDPPQGSTCWIGMHCGGFAYLQIHYCLLVGLSCSVHNVHDTILPIVTPCLLSLPLPTPSPYPKPWIDASPSDPWAMPELYFYNSPSLCIICAVVIHTSNIKECRASRKIIRLMNL